MSTVTTMNVSGGTLYVQRTSDNNFVFHAIRCGPDHYTPPIPPPSRPPPENVQVYAPTPIIMYAAMATAGAALIWPIAWMLGCLIGAAL